MQFARGYLTAISLLLLLWPQEEPEENLFLSLHEVEAIAERHMPRAYFDYYAGCADSCITATSNERDWARIKLLPRMLRDVSRLDTSASLWGMNLSMPLIIAPMAMHGLADREHGELATLRASASAGIPFSLSSMATRSIREVSTEASRFQADTLFQLYVIRDRGLVKQWVESVASRRCW